jgi:hypothetical protein
VRQNPPAEFREASDRLSHLFQLVLAFNGQERSHCSGDLLAILDAQLRKGDKALIGNSAYRR